jgi:hypothetical protein
MTLKRIYDPVPDFSHEEIKSAIQRDDVDSLAQISFSIGYHCADWKYAQCVCLQLSDHPNKTVRGNAILGLSYVALFRRKLDKLLVKPVLIRGLRDSEEEVRERARDAVIEINRAMKWRIADYHKKEKAIGIEENEEASFPKRR